MVWVYIKTAHCGLNNWCAIISGSGMVRSAVHADHTVLSPSDTPPTQQLKKRQLAGTVTL